MLEFPAVLQIPLAEWVDRIMDWVLENLGPFFDFLGAVGLQVLLFVENVLLAIPWFVVLAGVAALAWRSLGRLSYALVMTVMLMLIGSFGYWDMAMRTLAIVITAVVISLVIGIPAGILMAWSDRFETIIKPVLDAMQTLPTFVYLIPALMLFGLGKVPATFATIIYAVPPVIRLTNVGIREVPHDVIEAARAFGSSRREILFNVQLPPRPALHPCRHQPDNHDGTGDGGDRLHDRRAHSRHGSTRCDKPGGGRSGLRGGHQHRFHGNHHRSHHSCVCGA